MIALGEIIDALEFTSDGITVYFNRQPNEIILVTEDDLHTAKHDSMANVPEWQKETIAIITLAVYARTSNKAVLAAKQLVHKAWFNEARKERKKIVPLKKR